MPDVAQAVVPFIREQLKRPRSCDGDKPSRPLLVGIQGPQGCGKTTMSACVKEVLAASDPPIHVEVLSLDDLYLPKTELDAIAMAHTTNALLQGRGQPGTHDTVLGSHIFAKLLAMRGSDAAPVQVPVFDKSCHQGQGDRLPEPRVVRPPVDVVLFEGWCVGFECLCENVLSEKYAEALASPEPWACKQHPIATLRTINRNLRAWKDQWYPLFDAMIQIMPKVSSGKPWDLVYPWRLEAEHKMKTANGGRGMTDEQVMQFVQRYMPSYELFCNDLQHKTLWPERTLCIDLDASRKVVGLRRA